MDDFFSGAYATTANTVNVLTNAQQSASASISVADFTGWSICSQFQNNLTDFIPDNLNTGSTGISVSDILVINITDAGHVTIDSPQITSAFGDYEMIIFNFPNATSVDFSGGSVHVDGTQLNTSAPSFWLPAENALLAKYAEKIIWNFPEAESMDIYASGVVGSVLALDTYIEGHGGSINGMLIADTFIMANGHELHSFMLNNNIFDFTNNTEDLVGSVVLYKVDADDNDIFLRDAVFRLEVWDDNTSSWLSYSTETDSLTTNRYGRITVAELPEGEYRFVEITPPNGYDLPSNVYHEFTIDAVSGVNAAVVITAKNTKTPELTTEVTILKLDFADNNKVLAGAQFALYRLEDSGDVAFITDQITTDANGQFTITDLTAGTYYLMEYSPPDNYDLLLNYFVVKIIITQDTGGNLQSQFFLSDGTEVFLSAGGDLEIFNEALQDTRLVLSKVDADDGSRLSGAVFDLYVYDAAAGDWVLEQGNLTTNDLGYFTIDALPDGQYKLVEVTPPDGYENSGNSFEFTIANGLFANGQKEYIITAKNNAIEGSLEIEKTDSNTGAFLADTEFALYRVESDSAMIKVTSLVTDANGKASVSNLEQGTYWLEETKAPYGYLTNTIGWEFVVGEDSSGTILYDHVLSIGNDAITGSVKLTKVDGDDTGITLAGVTFNLYVLDEVNHIWLQNTTPLTTDANGVLELSGLALGSYKLVEISNPNYGYEAGQMVIFSITSSGVQDLTITMRNYKAQFPALAIYKVDYDDISITLPGARFVLYRSDTGDFETSGAYEVYGTAVSDQDGRINFPELVAGHYRLVELVSPDGYILENRELLFEVQQTAAGLRVYIDGIDVTDFMTEALYIDNRKATIDVSLLKVDSGDTSMALPDAEFNVYYSESGNDGTFTKHGTFVSDSSGVINLQSLEVGFYRLVEIESPIGYESGASAAFEVRLVGGELVVYFNGSAVDADGGILIENTKLVENENQTIGVNLVKVDSDDHNTLLPDAIFNLYYSESGDDGTFIRQGTTLSDGSGVINLQDLEVGFYHLVEIQSPTGYESGASVAFEVRETSGELGVYYKDVEVATGGGIMIGNSKLSENNNTGESSESNSGTSTNNESSSTSNPGTGDTGIRIALYALLLLGSGSAIAIIMWRKKKMK